MQRAAIIAMLTLGLATGPAAAAVYDVSVTGNVIFNNVGSNPVTGLGFGQGDPLVASWRIDLDAAPAFDRPVAGLIDPQRFYAFAVSKGRIDINGGTTSFRQRPASFGAILVLDNARLSSPAPAQFRLDQVVYTDFVRFDGGLLETYASDGLPPGAFLSAVNLGVSQLTVLPALPGLVTSVDRPDFAGLLTGGASRFLNFTIASGTPATEADLAPLPKSFLTVVDLSLLITPVPEPRSWGMLVAGFGLLGAALRRRTATSGGRAAV